jgi:hypothetical protein
MGNNTQCRFDILNGNTEMPDHQTGRQPHNGACLGVDEVSCYDFVAFAWLLQQQVSSMQMGPSRITFTPEILIFPLPTPTVAM